MFFCFYNVKSVALHLLIEVIESIKDIGHVRKNKNELRIFEGICMTKLVLLQKRTNSARKENTPFSTFPRDNHRILELYPSTSNLEPILLHSSLEKRCFTALFHTFHNNLQYFRQFWRKVFVAKHAYVEYNVLQ